MSKVPDKIFCDNKDGNEWGIWFNEPAFSTDVAYIRKDALVDWLQGCKNNPVITDLQKGNIQELIDHINEM